MDTSCGTDAKSRQTWALCRVGLYCKDLRSRSIPNCGYRASNNRKTLLLSLLRWTSASTGNNSTKKRNNPFSGLSGPGVNFGIIFFVMNSQNACADEPSLKLLIV